MIRAAAAVRRMIRFCIGKLLRSQTPFGEGSAPTFGIWPRRGSPEALWIQGPETGEVVMDRLLAGLRGGLNRVAGRSIEGGCRHNVRIGAPFQRVGLAGRPRRQAEA